MHIDVKRKISWFLAKTHLTLTAEKEYSMNFTTQQNKFSLRLNYNGLNGYIVFTGVAIDKLKEKDSEIYPALLFLGNA